ncbi:FAD:protein FMN transferase [Dysgonomonas sp. 520]|uniref:FAD:protein FMN transferase n=1 Tax=Dysgonomonas sp. 520 TaxID=2302931 RepID=UPI0013CF4405|nr:FAD:protein FMN transferase [Dysgonomonas sp. 520]NDW08938.1 FAD:protein FMN transferase [Dysgonomonas sp. 520]
MLYKTQTRKLFHAHIKIKFPIYYGDELFDELYAILEETDRLYNSYSDWSYIRRINENAGEFVEVDDETTDILRRVAIISDFFDGELDITIMPLIRLWGFYRNEQVIVPDEKDIRVVKKLVDYKQIEIDKGKVRVGKNQEIITGAFVKAYAVDKMIVRMQEIGISDAIVNAGGSTIKALANENHPFWTIAVKDPENLKGLFTLKLSNKCFSTSAQNKTFVEINGERYGHILSPRTGFPSTNIQVGIISDDCFTGDLISTGLFNLVGDEFVDKMKHLSDMFNIEGFMIDKNNNIFFSEKFKQYIIEDAL